MIYWRKSSVTATCALTLTDNLKCTSLYTVSAEHHCCASSKSSDGLNTAHRNQNNHCTALHWEVTEYSCQSTEAWRGHSQQDSILRTPLLLHQAIPHYLKNSLSFHKTPTGLQYKPSFRITDIFQGRILCLLWAWFFKPCTREASLFR